MGHFQLFSMILKFSMGHLLSFYTDLYGPFSKLMGLWRMAHCLPNHWFVFEKYICLRNTMPQRQQNPKKTIFSTKVKFKVKKVIDLGAI